MDLFAALPPALSHPTAISRRVTLLRQPEIPKNRRSLLGAVRDIRLLSKRDMINVNRCSRFRTAHRPPASIDYYVLCAVLYHQPTPITLSLDTLALCR